MAAAWPGLSEQDLGQGCGAAGCGGVSQGARAEEEGNRGRKPGGRGREPQGTAGVAAAGPEVRGSAHPSGPRTGLGARGPPGSWRATAGARVRTRGPDSLSKPRPPALATRLASLEGAASGPASCRRGARLTCRAATYFWCLGRPEEPGLRRGGLTGPWSRDPGTQAEAHSGGLPAPGGG